VCDDGPQQQPLRGANGNVRSIRILGLIYDIVVLAIVGSGLLFMFAGMDPGLYAAGGLGAVASFTLGYASLRRRLITLGAGVVRYGKLWVWMMVFAALSLITGKWEPLVFFAVIGVAMTLFYALGGWLGARTTR
jgi:hypothetical protein